MGLKCKFLRGVSYDNVMTHGGAAGLLHSPTYLSNMHTPSVSCACVLEDTPNVRFSWWVKYDGSLCNTVCYVFFTWLDSV